MKLINLFKERYFNVFKSQSEYKFKVKTHQLQGMQLSKRSIEYVTIAVNSEWLFALVTPKAQPWENALTQTKAEFSQFYFIKE